MNVLGNLYSQNQQVFSGTHIVNIDSSSVNTSFGQTNVLDTSASSVSEIMTSLISDLGYSLDQDSASNLLAGIFDATNNLQNPKITADTYMAVANCLRVGGRKPSSVAAQAQPAYDWNAISVAGGQKTVPQTPSIPDFMTPPVVAPVSPTQASTDVNDKNQASPEERPVEEGVISETVEPEWLTPKIFKGTNLG
ncbi:MAG: hypothetical protein UT04_C0082G0003 [Candidatus Daviesbacteria bacterium GW2011_GWF2_38_7]|nr:MAG: hypothetical protein UT04_C0082G0003 [Candidatus Daviesbacteria bacterium GW2011_GWF2_38_7]